MSADADSEREEAAAKSLGLTVAQYRRRFAPWRLPPSHVDYEDEPTHRFRARRRSPRGAQNRRRMAVYERDGGRCQYCGVALTPDAFTIDHVVPRSKGGGNGLDNLATACEPCNRTKADRLNVRPVACPAANVA